MICGIYEIRNKLNHHVYIGSATNFNRRWREHRYMLHRNHHKNQYLQNAWNKYGESVFVFQVLLFCNKELLIVFEQRAIDVINPEYNIASSVVTPMLGRSHTESAKSKISSANKGRKHTADTRANMSAAHMGHKASTKTRAKMSSSQKKYLAINKRVFSPETRAKIVAKQKGRKHSPEWRANISKGLKGHKVSSETRAKISAANKGNGRPWSLARRAAYEANKKGEVMMTDEHYCDCCGHVHGDLEAYAKIAKFEATNAALLDVVRDCVNFLADLNTKSERAKSLHKRAYTAHSKAKSHADTLKGE